MIQPLYDKMLDYLKMETEIPFQEFNEYYRETLNDLEKNYKEYDQEKGLQALFIVDNLKTNSDSRVQRKFPEAKKYKKIAERAQIWVQALFVHLIQNGMTEKEIQAKIEELYEKA